MRSQAAPFPPSICVDGFFISPSRIHMKNITHTPKNEASTPPKAAVSVAPETKIVARSAITRDEADDPLQEIDPPKTKYGPLYFYDGEKLSLNMAAIAKSYAEAKPAAFSSRDKNHYAYDQDQGLWFKQTRGAALWSVSEFIQSLSNDAIAALLLAKRTSALCRSVLQLVEGCAPMGESENRELVAVANGVLDLSQEKPVLRPFKENDWFTSKLPWKYDPEAKCERFLNDLVQPALGAQEDVDLLQRDFGRQLVAGNKAQTISVFVGVGGSGKTTLLSILEHILGEDRIAHLRTDKLTTRFETHAFSGKVILVGKDVPPNFLANSGAAMIKSLTGSDLLQSEKKYGGKHKMRGDFFVVITANTRLLLRIQGDEEAWRRRLVCYYYSQKVCERVAEFDKVLLAEEGSGILTWLVQGYLLHRSELKVHGRLQLTEAQQQRVDEWVDESRGVRSYLENNIKRSEGSLTFDELYRAYTAHAKSKGWKVPTKEAFGTDLNIQMLEAFQCERSNHIKHGNGEVRGYRGVEFVKAKGQEEVQQLQKSICTAVTLDEH